MPGVALVSAVVGAAVSGAPERVRVAVVTMAVTAAAEGSSMMMTSTTSTTTTTTTSCCSSGGLSRPRRRESLPKSAESDQRHLGLV